MKEKKRCFVYWPVVVPIDFSAHRAVTWKLKECTQNFSNAFALCWRSWHPKYTTVSIVDSNSENFWFPKHFLLTLQKPSHFIRKSFIQHNWITFIRWLKLNAVLKWNGIFMNFVSSGITFHEVASCRELTHFNLKRLIKL